MSTRSEVGQQLALEAEDYARERSIPYDAAVKEMRVRNVNRFRDRYDAYLSSRARVSKRKKKKEKTPGTASPIEQINRLVPHAVARPYVYAVYAFENEDNPSSFTVRGLGWIQKTFPGLFSENKLAAVMATAEVRKHYRHQLEEFDRKVTEIPPQLKVEETGDYLPSIDLDDPPRVDEGTTAVVWNPKNGTMKPRGAGPSGDGGEWLTSSEYLKFLVGEVKKVNPDMPDEQIMSLLGKVVPDVIAMAEAEKDMRGAPPLKEQEQPSILSREKRAQQYMQDHPQLFKK